MMRSSFTGTVHENFAQMVSHQPDAIAIRHDGATCTYQELAERALTIAHRLPPPPSSEQLAALILLGADPVSDVAAILGVVSVGGIAVPVDGYQPARRLAQIVEHCLPSVILVDPSLGTIAAEIAHGIPTIDIPRTIERHPPVRTN